MPEPVGATTRAWSPARIAVPGALLGRGGRGEGAGEPVPGRRGERVEDAARHGAILAHATDNHATDNQATDNRATGETGMPDVGAPR